MSTIAISVGEPAGIGPDILVMRAQQARSSDWLVFGSAQVLRERARQLGLPLTLQVYQAGQPLTRLAQHLTIVDVPCPAAVQAGQLQALNSPAVLQALTAAAQFCLACSGRALLTLPMHKGIINQAAIPFRGHTDYLAELSSSARVVMMLASATLKVALHTVHIPLSQVSSAITAAALSETLGIIQRHWQLFYAKNPKILVLGVNPHAGEGGYLGTEERDIMQPTLQALSTQGYDIAGPVAADTAFTPQVLRGIDVVLAMYHDQGLAPLKALAFGNIVNVSLGLPFIRTSVDHGVALDKAGTGRVHLSSFDTALQMAETMLKHSSSP